jgi:small subunit ribosomal protein S17
MTGSRGKRKIMEGIVVSDKMNKTVVVKVSRKTRHPVYNKIIVRDKKFMAHNTKSAKLADWVKIMEDHPVSKNKRWRVVEVVNKQK